MRNSFELLPVSDYLHLFFRLNELPSEERRIGKDHGYPEFLPDSFVMMHQVLTNEEVDQAVLQGQWGINAEEFTTRWKARREQLLSEHLGLVTKGGPIIMTGPIGGDGVNTRFLHVGRVSRAGHTA